ncbi:MAG: patatin-like phospholipase family protein [Halieaceae bacterium]
MLGAKQFKRATALLTTAVLSACATTYVPENEALTVIDDNSGYRRFQKERLVEKGDTTIYLAFSGGGTRAAAVSYGVMQELRDTLIEAKGEQVRVLDEVDTISSVSGGSFTSAYYGLYGDQLFETYEDDFLRRNVQGTLIKQLFNPVNWYKGVTQGFDRKELAIDYYERHIFKGATFADMREDGPFIEINATDLATGLRFTFLQERFDLMCADLDSFSVARAVTASSSVPVAFPTVVIKNHADKCDITESNTWKILEKANVEGSSQEHLVAGLKSYRDVDRRKFIHLVDGGISDNLGLRGAIDRLEGIKEVKGSVSRENPPKNILVILVNADVDSQKQLEETPDNPTAGTTMGAFLDAQMELYSDETRDRMRENVKEFNQHAVDTGIKTRMYFSEVSFDNVESSSLKALLNSMPTSLELEDDQIEQLIIAGRVLLRKEPSYMRFLEKNQGQRKAGAMSEREICSYLPLEECR